MNDSTRIVIILLTVFSSVNLVFSQGIFSEGYAVIGFTQSKELGNDDYNTTMYGGHIGIFNDHQLKENLYFEYGALYNFTAADFRTIKLNFSHWVDLPIRIVTISNSLYFEDLSLQFLLFGGPNINYTFNHMFEHTGVDKYKMEIDGKKIYSPLDVQIGGGVGLCIDKLGLKIGCDYSLINRSKNQSTTWKNLDFKISFILMASTRSK